MDKVTFFDVEYANSRNKSICQMGMVCEHFETGDPFYPELDVYVNPEDGFDNNCIRIHGITAERVAAEPTLPILWKDIEKYFTHTVVIGHNVASADLDALVKNLNRYNIDIPEIYYICTYELAKKYVPSFAVANYSMSTLCEYFDIDIDSEHNAFDDACACSDLFKALVENYQIDVDTQIKKYVPHESREFAQYISSPMLRKSISEFYGVIRGFSIDSAITDDEIAYLKQWKNEREQYTDYEEIAAIVNTIETILADNVVTLDEMMILQASVKKYLDIVSTSPITLATQILDGILKGITIDGEVTEEECKNLRMWLYDNIYLSDHFPFDKAIAMVDKVLDDGVVTKEEAEYITSVIDEMLNPVKSIASQANDVQGKHVCLTGNFAFGSKAQVEKYIVDRGGEMDASVKKTTDFLIVGDNECQAYANGTYGTKIKKAMQYIEKGCNICIVKEADFFASVQ